MDTQQQSTEQLTEKLAALQQEIDELKIAKVALNAQSKLLENLLKMAATPELEEVLNITLKQALEISSELTGAEYSCLVLLKPQGDVANSIVRSRHSPSSQEQSLMSSLVEQDYLDWVDHRREVTLIADTLNDERWQTQVGHPEVVRSVLSIPILKNQTLVGILTLMHSQLGHFTPQSAQLMQAIAQQTALAIEYARCYGQLETYAQALRQELEQGREIQQDFLPAPLLELPGWKLAAFFKPARQVSGDFYDVFRLPGGCVGLVIGDVCDKGVGAALFMGLFRSLLRLFSGQHDFQQSNRINENATACQIDPALLTIDALRAVILTNNYIQQNHGLLCMFATIFFGVLNPATGVLTYINGGHEAPIILRTSGARERLKPTGPCVGPMPTADFKIKEVQLAPGDILVGYSDGVPDARNPQRIRFTEKRLLSLLEAGAPTVNAVIERIADQVLSHAAEAEPYDDITILALQQSQVPTS